MWFNDIIYDADSNEDQKAAKYKKDDQGYLALTRVAAWCNRATFAPGSVSQRQLELNRQLAQYLCKFTGQNCNSEKGNERRCVRVCFA